MKLKADENIPTRVIRLLREHHLWPSCRTRVSSAHRTATWQRLPLPKTGSSSPSTEDSPTCAATRPGTHPGVFVVHARELRPSVILTLLATFLAEHAFDDFVGCNVVIEPGSVRARRPPDD